MVSLRTKPGQRRRFEGGKNADHARRGSKARADRVLCHPRNCDSAHVPTTKKGLLSNVNTEYHKKVIERMDELSKTLLDEYDFDSPNHWSKHGLVDDAVRAINKEFMASRDDILREGKFEPGIRTNPDYERLSRLLQAD